MLIRNLSYWKLSSRYLNKLEFNLTFASAYRYLERFTKITKWESLFNSAYKMMNYALIEYTMIKYDNRMLAAGALYLAYAIEKKSSQRKHSQNSSHSVSTHNSLILKGRDSNLPLSSTKFLSILCQETEKSENEIKKWAIDINVCKKAHGGEN